MKLWTQHLYMIDLQQSYHTSHISYRMVCIDGGQYQTNHVLYCMDHHKLIHFLGFNNVY